MNDHETHQALLKVAIAWIGATFGSVTLSEVAIVLTIIYTIFQFYFLMRDKWWRQRKV